LKTQTKKAASACQLSSIIGAKETTRSCAKSHTA